MYSTTTTHLQVQVFAAIYVYVQGSDDSLDDDDDKDNSSMGSFAGEEEDEVWSKEKCDLIDQIEELVGELEEELIKRDQLIERLQHELGELESGGSMANTSSDVTAALNDKLDDMRTAQRENLRHLEELQTMVALKEEHIQKLDRERGQLLLEIAQLRSRQDDDDDHPLLDSRSAEQPTCRLVDDDDSDSFELLEKVMRLEQRQRCLQTTNRELTSQVTKLEQQLRAMREERAAGMEALFDTKLDALKSTLSAKEAHISWLSQPFPAKDDEGDKVQSSQEEQDTKLAALESERNEILEAIRMENDRKTSALAEGNNASVHIMSNNSSYCSLFRWRLDPADEDGYGSSRLQSTSSQQSISPSDEGILVSVTTTFEDMTSH